MPALKGRKIIATSDLKKANKLGILLEKHGAQAINFPLIKVTAAANIANTPIELITHLQDVDWVVFSSSNGVTHFFEWLAEIQKSSKNYNWKYATIGNATAETLIKHGAKADFISTGKDAKEFANDLLQKLGSESKQILISAGNLSSSTIPEFLGAHHHCQKIVTYRTQIIEYSEKEILDVARNPDYDIVFFMSPSAVEGFYAKHGGVLKKTRFKTAVIGTTTRKALLAYGVTPDFMPSKPNLEVFVSELAQYFENKQLKYNN